MYPVLERLLRRYRDMLTTYEGDRIVKGAVTIVLAGKTPATPVLEDSSRLVTWRGPLELVDNPVFTRSRMPFVHEKWGYHFEWDGSRAFSSAEMRQLRSMVDRCHKANRKMIFWAAPDHIDAWRLLDSAGVDFIGTDHVEGLANYLKTASKRGRRVPDVSVSQAPRRMRRDAPSPAVAPFDTATAKHHQRAWADYLRVPAEVTNSIGMEFVLIPPGEFMMGSTKAEWEQVLKDTRAAGAEWMMVHLQTEQPQHRVRITKPFYLGKYEVTQAQWEAVMGNNPAEFKGKSDPVNRVHWDDIQPFLTKLNMEPTREGMTFALPSEAQWEHACRAGTETAFCFGDDPRVLGEYGWFIDNSGGTTHPTGRKKPNAWGLYDIHGNVFEACADRFAGDFYRQSPLTDPVGDRKGWGRACRGGAWHWSAVSCRSAFRGNHQFGRDHGFRVALEIPVPTSDNRQGKSQQANAVTSSATAPLEPRPTDRTIVALGGLPHAGPAVGQILDTPADPNRLYAFGRAGSIYFSTDGGATWSIRPLPQGTYFALSVAPADADHLLLAQACPPTSLAIMQSTDGGVTWDEMMRYEPEGGHGLFRTQFSPTNPNMVYLFSFPRVVRLDLGSRSMADIYEGNCLDMAIDPENGRRLYARGHQSLRVSLDGGKRWAVKDNHKGLNKIMAMAMDPSNGLRLAVAFKEMYLSEDGGDSWRDLGPVGNSYIDHIAFDPFDPQRIYAYDRLVGLTISSNLGRTWLPASDPVLNTYARAVNSLHVSRTTPGRVIVAAPDGIYRSTDGGKSFAAVHSGLGQPRIVRLAVDPTDPDHVLARTNSRVYYSDDAGRSWTMSRGLVGCADWTMHSLAVDGTGKNCFVANVDGSFYRSTDRGVSFQPLEKSPQFSSVVADSTKSGRLLGAKPGLQVSEDNGNTWSEIKGAPKWMWALAISPVDPQKVYASGIEAIYRLVTDAKTGAQEFVAATEGPAGTVRQITACPVDPNRAIAVDNGGGMWETRDGGATWTLVCAGFFAHPYVRASEPDAIYVTAAAGFCVWQDGELRLVRKRMSVNSYAETSDGLLLGTEAGLYLMR